MTIKSENMTINITSGVLLIFGVFESPNKLNWLKKKYLKKKQI
jgi:hypothetical protein